VQSAEIIINKDKIKDKNSIYIAPWIQRRFAADRQGRRNKNKMSLQVALENVYSMGQSNFRR